jgi:hypothetical protein
MRREEQRWAMMHSFPLSGEAAVLTCVMMEASICYVSRLSYGVCFSHCTSTTQPRESKLILGFSFCCLLAISITYQFVNPYVILN